jgi:hypothetical protein
MPEIFRHTDNDGYRVTVTTDADGGLMVSAFPVHDFNRINAVDLPAIEGRRLLAALERHYARPAPVRVRDGECGDCLCCTRDDCNRRACAGGSCPCTEG